MQIYGCAIFRTFFGEKAHAKQTPNPNPLSRSKGMRPIYQITINQEAVDVDCRVPPIPILTGILANAFPYWLSGLFPQTQPTGPGGAGNRTRNFIHPPP